MAKKALAIPQEGIARLILLVRGKKVILDADLAALYGTATKTLNRAVKRNRERFPDDFMFQLSSEEFDSLRCQFGTSKVRGGRRYAPYAFTEHGAIMAANLLNSERAIEVSVVVVWTFVRIREILATDAQLAQKLADLERRVGNHDEAIRSLVIAIRQDLGTSSKKKGKIGFARENEK